MQFNYLTFANSSYEGESKIIGNFRSQKPDVPLGSLGNKRKTDGSKFYEQQKAQINVTNVRMLMPVILETPSYF